MGVGTLARAIFFDRDGVLNRAVIRDGKPYPPVSVSQVELDEYAQQAVTDAHNLGYLAVVFTNQPDVARGVTSAESVMEINLLVQSATGVDATYACLHDDADDCACRKPKSGLLRMAERELRVDLRASFVIGDRWKDVAAGRSVGCRTILIDRGYTEKNPTDARADQIVFSLREAMHDVRALVEAPTHE